MYVYVTTHASELSELFKESVSALMKDGEYIHVNSFNRGCKKCEESTGSYFER